MSRHIFAGDLICYAYHEWEEDGWQFLPNRETTNSDVMLVRLEEVYKLDPSIKVVADLPYGWMASRTSPTTPWNRTRNHPFPVFDDDGFYLDDAEMYQRDNPELYQIPARETRDTLQIGDTVKLIFRFDGEFAPRHDNDSERMWVEVTEVDSENRIYRGSLLNEPEIHSRIHLGHALSFHPIHVFDIHNESHE